MKRKFWAISLLGAVLVAQTAPQTMVLAKQVHGSSNLLDDVSEERNVNESEKSTERALYDAKSEFAEKEETYVDRFIMKFAAINQEKSGSSIKTLVEKAFTKAKNAKDKLEEEYIQKLSEVLNDPEKAAQVVKQQNGKVDIKSNDIHIIDMDNQETKYEIIELPEKIEPDLFLTELEEIMPEEIEYVQPDYIMELSGVEVLPYGEIGISEYQNEEMIENGIQKIIPDRESDLQKAWEISKGDGITVALIDSGVDVTHPMIAKHIVTGYDFYNGKESVYDPNLGMEQAHGTHIAGIIAQTAPDVKIMPLKVFENGKAYTSEIIQAIKFAEENGASIVNMSFGCASYNKILEEVMEASKMFFVCAVGNNRKNIDLKPIYPASYELNNKISVAAFNHDLGMSFFSNYGLTVDISAWGRDVYSAYPGGDSGTMDGTSMAAGYISGAAALVAASGKTDIKGILKKSSDHVSCLENKVSGGNKVSFYDAVAGNMEKEVVIVEAEDDFNVFGLQATPEDNWNLFSAMENIQVACGVNHTVVLKKDGSVWAWGDNRNGQLGNGTKENSVTPQRVLGLTDIIQISAGIGRTFALRSDGTVYACGDNTNGQLGDGTFVNRTLPVKVNGLYDVTEVDAYGVSMALKEDGTVWTWGKNTAGQLGNGTNIDSSVPTKVPTLSGVTQIAAGNAHCLAVGEDRRLWSWGSNEYGQLGNGTNKNSWTPIQVGDLEVEESRNPRIQKTIVARSHNLVINDRGGVWAWGYDRNGQLGNEAYINELEPRLIYKLPYAVAVAASSEHSMALTANGFIYTWGKNDSGELGDGTTITKPYYQEVASGFYDKSMIAAGNNESYAINGSGSIYNWGKRKILRPEKMTGIMNAMNTDFENAIVIPECDFVHYGCAMEANQYMYYSFEAPYTTVYTFESISSLDMYGQLYDANRKILAGNDTGEGNGESENLQDFYIKQELKAGEMYYLGVKASALSGSSEYAIKVKYLDDFGNDAEHAFQISKDESQEGKINYPEDADFFKFIPDETASYIFYTTEASSVSGTLFAHNNTRMANSDIISNNNKNMIIKANLEAGQSYYIKIEKGSLGWSNLDKYIINIKKNEFSGIISLENGITVKADMKNENSLSNYCIKLVNSEKIVISEKNNITLSMDGELKAQLTEHLETGTYRVLILADSIICKVVDIKVLGKEDQKFVDCDNGAELLIPYMVSTPIRGEEVYFSLAYNGYELVDACSATPELETEKGVITGGGINVVEVESDYIVFQSIKQNASGIINEIVLKNKKNAPSFMCYAYKVY